MPLVTDEAAEEPVVTSAPELRPRPVNVAYQDNVINTKEVDHSSLLTFISGSSWTVNYYGQVLGIDQVGITLQLDQSGVYQQYRKIVGLEFKSQGGLSQDQDPETKLFTVTGTSNIYPSIKPNVGDMFVADVGDGRSAVFTLSTTKRLSIYQESGYEVSYTLVGYSTESLMSNLESKVVETSYFNKEGLKNGTKAFLKKEEVVQLESVKVLLERLTGAYTRRYWDKEFNTILYTDIKGRRVYDHFLVTFLKKLPLPWSKAPAELNCNGIDEFDCPTLWDTLISGDRYSYDNVEYMQEVYPSRLSQFPVLGGIAWSTMELTRIPMVGKLPVELPPETPFEGDYHVSTLDKHYALSSWYYNDHEDGMSKLERYLMMWFKGKSLETTEIIRLAEDVHNWDDLSQFYQTPILLVLLQSLEM